MLTDNANEPVPEEQESVPSNSSTPVMTNAEAVASSAEPKAQEEVSAPATKEKPENIQGEAGQTPDTKELSFRKVQEALSSEGAKEKKDDAEQRPAHFPVTSQRRQQIEKLFVPPPDYEAQQPLFEHCRIGIVYGPDYADRIMCAEHLGLLLTGQLTLPNQQGEGPDPYVELEQQVEELLRRLDNYPQASIVTTLALSLDQNLRNTRMHGDTRELQYERNTITLQLTRIATATLGLSLRKLRYTAPKATTTLRNLWILDWSRDEQLPLTELVNRLNENDVYIVRRPLVLDMEFEEQLEAVSAHLTKRNTILILIQNLTERELLAQCVCRITAYPPLDTDAETKFVRQVFQNYFTYFGAAIPTATRGLLNELVKIYLNGRFLIAGFMDELRSLEDEASEEKIRTAAEGMGDLDPKYARNRFQKWSYNHQLYAMLVVLFNDVSRPTLDTIYTAVVAELRNSGITTLCDPREIGMDDMLHTIRAQEMDDRRIYFQYDSIAAEVDRQIDNHRHLLWSLLKVILGWVDKYRAPEYWQLRKALGAALGRMGLHQMEELEGILEELAHNSSGGVVVVASYALDRICRIAPDKHNLIIQILRDWVESGDPDLMWAVGATIWRIYDGLVEIAQSDDPYHARQGEATLDEIGQVFTTLVQNFKYFNGKVHARLWKQAHEEQLTIEFIINSLATYAALNLDAILHAVRQIAWRHPAHMVAQIRTWLQAEAGNNQVDIGLLAGYQLFEANAQPDISFSDQQQLPLLGLIQPLLAVPEEPDQKRATVDIVLQALLSWFQHTNWSEQIQTYLLYLLNRSTAEIATFLCDSIARNWLECDEPAIQQAGRALMLRAYAIHGTPLDLPDHHKGLIIVDAADSARANQEGALTGAAFYRRFAPRLDLYLRRMGDLALQIAPGQPVVRADLQLYHSLPALMMPSLQAATLTRLAFILVLTWDTVIDAADLAGTDANHLVVALFGDQASEHESLWPEQVKVSAVQRDGTGREAIDQAVNQLLAQALLNQSAAEWWSGLQPYFVAESATLAVASAEQVVRQLQEWLPRLDQLEYCRYPNDLMRIVVYTAGWLAKTDLPLCVETLQGWLEKGDPNQRLAGTACGKFLFTLFMAGEPPSVELYAQLMGLAPSLGKQNWDATQTILQAAYRWSIHPDWKKRLLVQPTGETGELLAMIDQTASLYEKQMTDLFDAWKTGEPAAGEEKPKPVTDDFVELLRLRLALSSRQPLSGLLADGTYGLILVDTAVHNFKKRRRLVGVAAKIIELLTDKLKQQTQINLQLLVYRLGRDHLVAGPGEKPDEDVLLPTSPLRPRLFGALLERFTPQQIGFVLVFTDELPNDGEDWRHSELQRRILFYADEPRPDWASIFTVLPKEENLDKTVAMIANYLLKRIGV